MNIEGIKNSNENSSNTRNRFNDDEESSGIKNNKNLDGKLLNENNNLLGELRQSLNNIKLKSHIIKDKLESSNKSAEEIGDYFDKSLKIISDTMNKLSVVLRESGGLYCYLAIFVLVVLFLIFFRTVFLV
jgi:hypothetical protein